jgi:hypothetical protein
MRCESVVHEAQRAETILQTIERRNALGVAEQVARDLRAREEQVRSVTSYLSKHCADIQTALESVTRIQAEREALLALSEPAPVLTPSALDYMLWARPVIATTAYSTTQEPVFGRTEPALPKRTIVRREVKRRIGF